MRFAVFGDQVSSKQHQNVQNSSSKNILQLHKIVNLHMILWQHLIKASSGLTTRRNVTSQDFHSRFRRLRGQRLRVILAGAPDEKLSNAFTDFVNVLLNSELPLPMRTIVFGDSLSALEKKRWKHQADRRRLYITLYRCQVRPLKCDKKEKRRVAATSSVPRGIEAAVHAVCRFISHIPDDHVLVRPDFGNGFNTIRMGSLHRLPTRQHSSTALYTPL